MEMNDLLLFDLAGSRIRSCARISAWPFVAGMLGRNSSIESNSFIARHSRAHCRSYTYIQHSIGLGFCTFELTVKTQPRARAIVPMPSWRWAMAMRGCCTATGGPALSTR